MKSLFSLLFVLLVSHAAAAESHVVYQCPMHPWIKSDHPGDKCTLCGMALVAAPAGSTTADADPNVVKLSAAAASVVGVQTSAVTRGPLERSLRVAGVIDDDDTRHRIIGARVPGRVEKLFVNYVGAEVRAGEPLATIYSPEMLTAQRQYVERLRAGGAFPEAERAAAKERLLNLGLTAQDVDILEHTLEPTAMVNVRAPESGTVVARHVYEGQEINKDQTEAESRLFEIADFSSMWFVFDAYESDLAWLRPGQDVDIAVASQPGKTFRAPIAFIDPNFNEMTRTAKVRVVMPNHDHLLFHKQTASGTVRLTIPDVLQVPRTAVLQHGAEPVVFLEQEDHGYLARRVRLGRVGDHAFEVLGGLNAGDRVVTQGGLILDGQAQLARAALTGEPADVRGPAKSPEITVNATRPPAAALSHLKALAFTAADAAVPLAADDLPGYARFLPALRRDLGAYLEAAGPMEANSPLAKLRDSLPDPADLRSARRAFEVLSTELADEVRRQKLAGELGLHIYQCPMAPVLGTARWLSRTTELRNPFFGSAMPECGEEIKEARP